MLCGIQLSFFKVIGALDMVIVFSAGFNVSVIHEITGMLFVVIHGGLGFVKLSLPGIPFDAKSQYSGCFLAIPHISESIRSSFLYA